MTQEETIEFERLKTARDSLLLTVANLRGQIEQREWVGLTDDEISEWTPEIHGVIQAIEAKLKDKNNANN